MKQKNRLVALILAMFLGMFGIDRLYLGKYFTGFLKFITMGGFFLWWFIDVALLMTDAFLYTFGKETGFVKDAKGNELKYGLSLYRFKNGKTERDWS